MADKPLVIDTAANSQVPSDLNKWHPLEQQDKFISSIETATINDEGGDVGAIVSGIPTVFARVNLFRSAISAMSNPSNRKDEQGNLQSYYSQLAGEWCGIVAAIACDYPNFSVRRVNMQYSDGKSITTTGNIYEPKGAFGNMLMVGRAKWCNLGNGDPMADVPFIDIIKYNRQVVGGSSPETMVFTSIGYHLVPNPDHPWIDNKTGRFTDPLNQNISMEQLRTLYAYVGYLLRRLQETENYFNESDKIKADDSLRADYAQLNSFMQQWRDRMVAHAQRLHWDISGSSIPTVNIFDLRDNNGNPIENRPYSLFFNYQNKLWGLNGVIWDTENPNAIPFDPQELLLPEESDIARVIITPGTDTDNLPVYLLKANMPGTSDKAYFALPLTPKALKVFGNNLRALVGAGGDGTAIRSELTAEFDPETKRLEIQIKLVNTNDNNYQICKRAYNIKDTNRIFRRDILIWPNFISKNWNRYFLYSEMPHDVSASDYPYRAVPFAGDINNDFRTIEDESGEPMPLAGKGVARVTADVTAKLLVVSDNRVAESGYKYEIYESNQPFKGVELSTQRGTSGGYLIIRYASTPTGKLPLHLTQAANPSKVNLGIDFGSTNTSIAYYNPSGAESQAQGFTFQNLRVSLFGNDTPSHVATPNELFFFPNTEIASNAIKSTLTLHDIRRLTRSSPTETDVTMLSNEVKGGFPCFVRNLPVQSVQQGEISLNMPKFGTIHLINDMKWTEKDEDKAHKEAFLRTLLLQVYAQLFTQGLVPTKLIWSYPSAMSQSLCTRYMGIWSTLQQVCPVLDLNAVLAPGQQTPNYPLDVATYNANIKPGMTPKPQQQEPKPAASQNGFFSGSTNNAGGWGQPVQQQPEMQQPAMQQTGGFFGGQSQPDGGLFGNYGNNAAQTAKGATWPIENPNAQISYHPQLLVNGGAANSVAISEACAVANFLTTKDLSMGNSTLTLCFDIGGSTTDITALCKLISANGGLTMIKQNSIRFAAQNVAEATKYSPKFRNVLLDVCHEFNLNIEGLSQTSAFSSETAPYYFEQIVDRLTTEQLPSFYRRILTNCQELMCVNLYVTGLIIFYAGQLAAKLVRQLMNSPENMLGNMLPTVNITFAGKGSRLFEWWSTTNPDAARQYYINMFIKGMGGPDQAMKLVSNNSGIDLSSKVSPDIKFEVSKGLACSNTSLFVPQNNAAVEIIGEDGFVRIDENYQNVPLPADHILTPDMMADLDCFFTTVQTQIPCPQFASFCYDFYVVASQLFNMKITQDEFINAFNKMNIVSYVRNLPEYRMACQRLANNQTPQFDFIAPIIILEGTKFFKENLLPSLQKK